MSCGERRDAAALQSGEQSSGCAAVPVSDPFVPKHALHLAGGGQHQHAGGECDAIQLGSEFDCAAAGREKSEDYVLGVRACGIDCDAGDDACGDCDPGSGAPFVSERLSRLGSLMKNNRDDVLIAVDMAGTFLFAIEG